MNATLERHYAFCEDVIKENSKSLPGARRRQKLYPSLPSMPFAAGLTIWPIFNRIAAGLKPFRKPLKLSKPVSPRMSPCGGRSGTQLSTTILILPFDRYALSISAYGPRLWSLLPKPPARLLLLCHRQCRAHDLACALKTSATSCAKHQWISARP